MRGPGAPLPWTWPTYLSTVLLLAACGGKTPEPPGGHGAATTDGGDGREPLPANPMTGFEGQPLPCGCPGGAYLELQLASPVGVAAPLRLPAPFEGIGRTDGCTMDAAASRVAPITHGHYRYDIGACGVAGAPCLALRWATLPAHSPEETSFYVDPAGRRWDLTEVVLTGVTPAKPDSEEGLGFLTGQFSARTVAEASPLTPALTLTGTLHVCRAKTLTLPY